MQDIRIGDRLVGDKHPVYVIAEVGLNHQGDIRIAKHLVDEAVAAGADCVKFQKRALKDLYLEDALAHPERQEHSQQYLIRHVVQCELTEDEMTELKRYVESKGADFMCTPWDRTSLRYLQGLGVTAYKIGSPDMTNLPLLKEAATFGMPLLVSTGMSSLSDIWEVIGYLETIGATYVMLHCNSTYPTPYGDINLNFLKTLREKSRYPIGFSGHEQGFSVALAAVALGARVIEKHISTDRSLPGPDHKSSLLPNEFRQMVEQIRIIETALGDPSRFASRGEFLNRENLSKSLVAKRPLAVGHVLTEDDIDLKSPGKGVSPLRRDYFVGKALSRRDLPAGEYLLESDVDAPAVSAPMPDIRHHWGVVARMCDIEGLLHCGSPYVEIHLSDGDVKNDVINPTAYDRDLVMHAPEYHDDLLLDLSSLDDRVRERSVDFVNKALDHGRRVKRMFRNGNGRVMFVVHPGGMSMGKPLLAEIDTLNENLFDSLRRLNADGFEVLVENMPACPWYFGGQWFHASFMDASEIADFSRRSGFGVVFDTAHAALYCNYYKKDLLDYTRTILPVAKYVHVSDAAGNGGEGLQIGDGSIDFAGLMPMLAKTDLWFLPEIWQGHKFGGEGFMKAIRTLKSINADF